MFIDKINGLPVSEIEMKYNYSKRTAYTHINRGQQKFVQYLERKDVLLWATKWPLLKRKH